MTSTNFYNLFSAVSRQRNTEIPLEETVKNDVIIYRDLEGTGKIPLKSISGFQKMFTLFKNVHDYSVDSTRKYILLVYIFLLLIYIGMNFGLLSVNFQPQAFIEAHYYLPFHLVAFWGVFSFTLIEAFLLVSAGIVSIRNIFQSTIVLGNVISSLLTAILFSMYPTFYEVPAHYIEYSIQIFVTGVNIIFVTDYIRKAYKNPEGLFKRYPLLNKLRWIELIVSGPVLLLSVLQLFIYSGLIPVTIEAERAGHFCEFVNEIVNGFFALIYTVTLYWGLESKLENHYRSLYNYQQ